MQASAGVVTFLFTDIEGSTRLWEQEPERMRPALARHDAITREVVERNRGVVVKMSGDGVHAAFADPLDAVTTTLELQQILADPEATAGFSLHVRCGLHSGVDEQRDNDFFGNAVNRAARISRAAHGGQILLSQVVAALVVDRLPAEVALRDLGAARLRDLASPERIYQVVHPALRGDFPALRTLEATPNNLPLQLTSFIGRERERVEVKRLLGNSRLVTLQGVGGIGKTRLSLQIAADLMDVYSDGIWFVELASLTDPQWVAQAVASVLGVKEDAGRPVIEALKKHVTDRHLLLVLDNCEHLVRACAELSNQLLQSGPRLTIIASSRERLQVEGETTYPVPALAIPDSSSAITPETLTQYESVRLLLDRAVSAQPEFCVTEQNAVAISEICRRLDGIPLALELAAARVRALSVENIAMRLNDRFRLLTSGNRTALPRQQTLRALIDWSHDLLTKRERTLFCRFAVFAGGWTLEAAEEVGAGDDIRRSDVLDLLTQLVEEIAVVIEPKGERYRLLDTVREYAQIRLKESGDENQAQLRHLTFYLRLAENARPALVGPEQGVWLARLDLERENLLIAHAWCGLAEGMEQLGLRLVHNLRQYWVNRGLLGLGRRVMVEALARAGAQERSPARCRALFDAGQLCCFMGQYGDGQTYLEESLAIAREIGDRKMVAIVLQPLGMALLGRGNLATAGGHFREALALAREQGDKRELAAALNALAQLHRLEEDFDVAEPLYEQALSLARELGDRESVAIGLLNLAMVSIGRGSDDRAQAMLREVLVIAAEIGSKQAGQSALEVSAGLGVLRKEWAIAARFYGAVEAQTAHTGIRRDPADDAFLAPLIERSRAALGAAAFATAESNGRTLSYEEAMQQAQDWLQSAP